MAHRDPAPLGSAPPRHEAMHVGMQHQRLTPGVERREEPGCAPRYCGSASKVPSVSRTACNSRVVITGTWASQSGLRSCGRVKIT